MGLFDFLKPKSKGFSVPRFQGRLYGFAWVILEKRDPKYNGGELRKEQFMIVVLNALSFTTDEESKVITQLLDKIKSAPDVDEAQNKSDSIKGALEGKLVIYKNHDIKLLLEENDIK